MPTPVTIIAAVVVAALVAGVLRRHVVWVTGVTSWSMAPSLRPGDRLLTTAVRDGSRLRRGRVVVIDSAELNQRVIKRVVGLPGEHVHVDHDGVRIDDTPLHEPWAVIAGGRVGSFVVPEGALLVLGDNRAASSDSRSWRNPYVPFASVLGVVHPIGRAGNGPNVLAGSGGLATAQRGDPA